jgi:hypothetical protein
MTTPAPAPGVTLASVRAGGVRLPRAAAALAGVAIATLGAASCATGGSRQPSLAPPPGLRGARTVWIVEARSRTGELASGERGEADVGSADVREELASAVRRVRGLELAPARAAADLVLYFEQADRLRCFRCRQPEDLWYWWGAVHDRAGRELLILHGETKMGTRAPARRFVAELRALARGAGRAPDRFARNPDRTGRPAATEVTDVTTVER